MSGLSCAVEDGKAVFKNSAKQGARQRPLAEHCKAGRKRHPPCHALQAKKILTNFFASVTLLAILHYFFTRSLPLSCLPLLVPRSRSQSTGCLLLRRPSRARACRRLGCTGFRALPILIGQPSRRHRNRTKKPTFS